MSRPLASLILLLLVGTARPAASAVVIEAVESAGPHFKRSQPYAITVTVENTGPALQGRITAEIPHRDYGYGTRSKIDQPISLPAGSRKSVMMLFPNFEAVYLGLNHPADLPVQVVDKSGTVVASDLTHPKMIMDDDVLMLALSPSRGGFDSVLGFKPPATNSNTRAADWYVFYPQVDSLPDLWAGYASTSLLILSQPGRLSLKNAQISAITDWVAAGGTLLIIPSGDPGEMDALKNLLPARVLGIREAPPSADLATPDAAMLRLGGTAEIVRGTASAPFLVRGGHGLGQVYLAAVDISNPRILTDNAARDWWREIVSTTDRHRKQQLNVGHPQMLATSPQLRPPSLGGLTLFLLVYVLLVGPVNYFLLKRRDQLLWMYVTVPILALTFSAVSFAISYYTKGSIVLLRQISVAQIAQGSDEAVARTWFSLFSPRHADYSLSLRGKSVVRGELDSEERSLTTALLDGFVLRDVNVEMWAMRRFFGDTVVPLPATTSFHIDSSNRLHMQNGADISLEKCVVYRGGMISEPFDLAAGNSVRPLRFNGNRASTADQLTRMLRAVWSGFDNDEADVEESRELLAQSLSEELLSKAQNTPLLLGWSRAPLVDVNLGGRTDRPRQATLVVVRGSRP